MTFVSYTAPTTSKGLGVPAETSQLDAFSMGLDRLDSLVATLGVRLDGVLSPNLGVASDAQPEQPVRSQIARLNSRLAEANGVLDCLIGRLEV